MPGNTITAMLVMLMTLVIYTVAVQYEQRQKKKKLLYALLLWLGFVSGSVGLGLISGSRANATGFVVTAGRICGIIAVLVVMVHAIWATAVLVLKDEKSERILRRDGNILWKIWLVPFLIEILLYIVMW